jgi:hypothetical protein
MSLMTATTKRSKPTRAGSYAAPAFSAPDNATRHDNVSMERITEDGFRGSRRNLQERHALVVGERHFCCDSND